MAAKFTVDTANKLFILNSGVTSLDVKVDLYSDAKEDWKDNSTLNRFRFSILAVGGQDIGGGQTISPYYILQSGWKVRPQEANHTLIVIGNLITDDGSPPIIATVGDYNVLIRSQITSSSLSSGESGLTQAESDKLFTVMTEAEIPTIQMGKKNATLAFISNL